MILFSPVIAAQVPLAEHVILLNNRKMRKLVYLFMLVWSFSLVPVECLAVSASDTSKDIQQMKANHDYTDLISAIITVESRGDVNAVSKNGKCCGVLQITPILVKEVNNILGQEKYTLQDRFDKEKSIEMFYIIQDKHNPSHNLRRAISLWNKSEWYYNKVMKHYKGEVAAK